MPNNSLHADHLHATRFLPFITHRRYKAPNLAFISESLDRKLVEIDPAKILLEWAEEGVLYVTEISNSLEGYTRGNEIQTTTLIESLAAYISLLRHHIHKEDHSFYQIVRQAFSEAELRGLVGLFDSEEGRVAEKICEDSKETVQEMASML